MGASASLIRMLFFPLECLFVPCFNEFIWLAPKRKGGYSASAGHLNNNLYLWLMAMEISFWIGRQGRNLTRISSRPWSHGETFMGAFKMTIIFLPWDSDQFYLLEPNIVLDDLYSLVYFLELLFLLSFFRFCIFFGFQYLIYHICFYISSMRLSCFPV